APGRAATLRDRAAYGVGQRPRHVPRLGVPELPGACRPGQLAGGAATAYVALPLTPGELGGDVAQQGATQVPHRLGAQAQVARTAALQVPGLAQGALEVGERPGVHRSVVAELTRERVEVDVIHAGAGVRLRQLLGERLEVGD